MQMIQSSEELETVAKKVIIVIGNKGSGKSAFVRMLVAQSLKNQVISSSANQSVTSQCSIYPVDQTIKLAGDESLYVIDTPGLDSEAASFVIIEKIEALILKQKCQIVSIVLALNMLMLLGSRIGHNEITHFYNNLKLRHSVKKNVMFCLLTNCDRVDEEEEEENLSVKFKEYDALFRKLDIQTVWANRVKWISEGSSKNDSKKIQKIRQDSSHRCYKTYSEQWKNLTLNLTRAIGQYHFQSINEYKEQIFGFEDLLLEEISKQLINPSCAKYEDKMIQTIRIDESDYWGSVGSQLKTKFKKLLKMPILGLIRLPFVVVIGIPSTMLYQKYKQHYYLGNLKGDNLEQEQNNRLKFRVQEAQRRLLRQVLSVDKHGSIKIQRVSWIAAAKIIGEAGDNSVKDLSDNKYYIFTPKQPKSQFEIELIVKCLTGQQMAKILERSIVKFFGKR